MAHIKKAHEGQRLSAPRKRANREKKHQHLREQAAILGITLLALEARQYQEWNQIMEEKKREQRKEMDEFLHRPSMQRSWYRL